jgi:hypothetical protein
MQTPRTRVTKPTADEYMALRDDVDDLMAWRNRVTKKPVSQPVDPVPSMVRVSDMPKKRGWLFGRKRK